MTNPITKVTETIKFPYQRSRLHTITPKLLGPRALSLATKSNLNNIAAATIPLRDKKVSALRAHVRFSFINPKYVKSTVEQGRGLTLMDDPQPN